MASGWWRNMSLLGGSVDASSDWFSEEVTRMVGNGLRISFWFDSWAEETPLRIQFQRLFQDLARVLVQWGRWVVGLMVNGSPISVADNSWRWRHDPSGLFSVKSADLVIRQSISDEVFISEEELRSKSVDHLFVSCNQISLVWYAILCWLGVEWVSPRGNLGLFEVFLGMSFSRKNRLGWLLIWQAIAWTIWNSRNDVLFSEGTFSAECLVDRVKLLSWKWFL
ncbi:pentatricopeptide repeat-containing protein [Trifolium medium]|uniref:Pentatricopeptide repeat-containing protein n=1 Tax=Trifolium medium TaxID=97028 RepID=A0A392N230_9FABA|nr:pentatricopeptide repeat-containing protein [Trifolium medium]